MSVFLYVFSPSEPLLLAQHYDVDDVLRLYVRVLNTLSWSCLRRCYCTEAPSELHHPASSTALLFSKFG